MRTEKLRMEADTRKLVTIAIQFDASPDLSIGDSTIEEIIAENLREISRNIESGDQEGSLLGAYGVEVGKWKAVLPE